MASVEDREFNEDELNAQVQHAQRLAEVALGKNKQESYVNYATLAAALAQALRERDEARASPKPWWERLNGTTA